MPTQNTIDSARSKSADKYRRVNSDSRGVQNDLSLKTRRELFYLKSKVTSATPSARRNNNYLTPQQETSYNTYFLKTNRDGSSCASSRLNTNGSASYTNIKKAGVIRKIKGDVKPLKVNLDTKRLNNIGGFPISKPADSSREKTKNKVFK